MKREQQVNKQLFPTDEVRTANEGAFETEQIPTSPASNLTNRGQPRKLGCKARLKRTNLRVTVPLRGHLSVWQAVLILIVNLMLPGIGTALLACTIDERLYLSDTALELVRNGEFKNEFSQLI